MSSDPAVSAIARPLLERTDRLLRHPRRDRLAKAVLVVAVLVYAALALYLTRGVSFTYDGVNWIVQGADGFGPAALLKPHNEHLIALTRLLYTGTVHLFGPSAFVIAIFQVIAVAASATLTFVLLRRMIDSVVAVVPAVLILFMGSTPVLLDPNVAVFAQATALGLGAFVALERGDRLGDVLACLLLLLSVLSFTLGVPFAVGMGVLIACRPDRLSRAWIVAVPLLVYAAWFLWAQKFGDHAFVLGGGGPEVKSPSNLLLAPSFAADSMAAALAAMTGLGQDFVTGSSGLIALGWGRVLAAGFLGFIIWRSVRHGLPVRAAAFGIILVVYWVAGSLALSLFRVPQIDRYVFPAAILCVLIAAELLRGMPVTRTLWLGLIAVFAFALPGNLAQLRATGAFVREQSADAKAVLTMVELERDRVAPELTPSGSLLIPIEAGSYLDFADRFGSFAFSEEELLRQSPGARKQADETLDRILEPQVVPAPGPPDQGCSTQEGTGGRVEFELPPDGAILRTRSEAGLKLRRFGDEGSIEAGALPAGRFVRLSIPVDTSERPWVGSIDGETAVEVCPIDEAAQ